MDNTSNSPQIQPQAPAMPTPPQPVAPTAPQPQSVPQPPSNPNPVATSAPGNQSLPSMPPAPANTPPQPTAPPPPSSVPPAPQATNQTASPVTSGAAAPPLNVPPPPQMPANTPNPATAQMPPPQPVPQQPGGATPGPSQENPTLVHAPTKQDSTKQPPKQKKGLVRRILPIIIGLLILVGVGVGVFVFLNSLGGSAQPQNNNSQQTSQPSSGALVPEGESITLEYLGLWESESIMRVAFDEFEAQNPGITINYTLDSPENYRQRLQSDLAKGEGPDIFRFHNTWVPMMRNDLAPVPADIYSVTEYQQTFYPVIYEDLRSDNGIVGIPLMIDGLGLYYNKAFFATAGKQVPTTWDELRVTAQDLTIVVDRQIERAGIALGLTGNVDHFSDIVGLMLLQNGANPAEPTSGLAQDALNFYLIFARSDNMWNATLPPSTFAFANEDAAMMIGPSWRAHEIVNLNPDLDFAVAPLPQLPEREVAWASYWVEGVSANSQYQEASWALLKFLSQKETLRSMYTAASQERLFGNPFPRIDMAEQLFQDPYVGAYIQQAPMAQSWYLSSRTYDNGINDRIIKYYEDLLNSDRIDESALTTVANGVSTVLSNYGVSAE